MKDEKQIEKILEKYGIDTYHWKPEIAKAIASLYEGWYPGEFVEWCLTEMNNGKLRQCYDVDNIAYWYLQDQGTGSLTLTELYRWWQDNVEGK